MTKQVEGKQREQMVFEATRAATDALKQMQQEMSLEAVEKLMEENADAITYQEEINRLLAQNLTPVDDAVIDEELNAMMAVMQGGEKAATPAAAAAAAAAVPELPHVPVDLPLPPRDEPSLVALQPMVLTVTGFGQTGRQAGRGRARGRGREGGREGGRERERQSQGCWYVSSARCASLVAFLFARVCVGASSSRRDLDRQSWRTTTHRCLRQPSLRRLDRVGARPLVLSSVGLLQSPERA